MMTPEENILKQFQLNETDVKEFEKNPNNKNSWVAKVFAECQAVSAIKEYEFLIMLRAVLREEKENALAEAEDEKLAEIRTEELLRLFAANLTPAPASKTTPEETIEILKFGIPAATIQLILQNQMRSLLSISQAGMNANQLREHHQKLTTNLSNQLSAQLGNTIILDNGQTLQVPQLSSAPLPSLDQVLDHNPGLADKILEDETPEMQKDFKTAFTQMELIRLAIKKAAEIRDANPEAELSVKDRINLQTKIDDPLHDMLKFDKTAKKYSHPVVDKLAENADLAMRKQMDNFRFIASESNMPSLSKPPAMFAHEGNSPRPTPQARRKIDEQEEIQWKDRNPRKQKERLLGLT